MLLIIAKAKDAANDLSDMLNFMGILSEAQTPLRAVEEISEKHRAILCLLPEKIYDEEKYLESLRTLSPAAPIFAIGKTNFPEGFDKVLPENLSAAEIFDTVFCYCENNGLRLPGEYKLGELDLSVRRKKPSYKNEILAFTKTELMILRTLITFSPSPLKPRDFLRFAFRAKRAPEETSVRTHISIINKKWGKISGRNIILNLEKQGYVIAYEEKIPAIKLN